MNKREFKIIFIICLGHFLCHTFLLVYPGALISIEDSFKDFVININNKTISLVSIIGFLSYLFFGLGALPAGFIATKTNAKLTLKIFFLFSAVSSILIGLPVFLKNIIIFGIPLNLITFIIGLPLLGLFSSLYHVSGLTLISQGIKIKGKAHGMHGVFGSLGIAFAPLIAGIVTAFIKWNYIYLIIAVPGILAFIFLIFDKDIPESHVHLKSTVHKFNNNKLAIAFFIIFMIVMGINGFIYRGFQTIFPTYVKNNFAFITEKMNLLFNNFQSGNMDITKIIGGIITAVFLSFGMLGQYSGGHLSDKTNKTRLYLIIVLLTIPFMFLIGILNSWLIAFPAILFAILHFAIQPVENYLISDYSPPKIVSSVYGMKFIITFGFGAFANTIVIFIKDNYNISNVFIFLSILIILSTAVIIILNIIASKLKILK